MKEAFIKLHIAVLIAGTSGLFGKFVTLNEFPLSLYRAVFAAVIMFAYMLLSGHLTKVPVKDALKMAGVGMLLGIHWIFFYGSIKYSNVSVGVVCFSLTGFFTAVFEPLMSHRKVSWKELLFSLLTIAGIALIFHFDTRYRTGIILGVISAALHSLFTVANKMTARSTGRSSSCILMFAMIGAAVILTVLVPPYHIADATMRLRPTTDDFLWLLVLASVTTVLLYILQIQSLKKISAFTVSLSFNLEPIYSIILAMTFFGEAKELNVAFYCGLALIFASVGLQTLSVAKAKPPVIRN